MSSRSTRNKLRHQVTKAVNDCERIQGHLKYMDELAAGGSDETTQALPVLVESVDTLQTFLLAFRDSL